MRSGWQRWAGRQRTISRSSASLEKSYDTDVNTGALSTGFGSPLLGTVDPRARRRSRHSDFVTGVYAPTMGRSDVTLCAVLLLMVRKALAATACADATPWCHEAVAHGNQRSATPARTRALYSLGRHFESLVHPSMAHRWACNASVSFCCQRNIGTASMAEILTRDLDCCADPRGCTPWGRRDRSAWAASERTIHQAAVLEGVYF